MEYHGWSQGEALRELRAAGYGYEKASEHDDYIIQFVQNYRPRGKNRQANVPKANTNAGGP